MSESTDGQEGRITVSRRYDTMGVLLAMPVVVDGRRVGDLGIGGCLTAPVPPGDHDVRVGRSRPVAVAVDPGALVQVETTHRPLPTTRHLVLAPRQSTRPLLTVVGTTAARDQPTEAALAATVRTDAARVTGALVRSMATRGALLVLAGATAAVLGRDDTTSIAPGILAAGLGLAALIAAATLRRAMRATRRDAPDESA